jgi:Bacterial mobilisation protein (MobC)
VEADVEQILKRKSGQAGSSDVHPYLRTKRLELYVSPQEFELIDGNRKSAGFHTIAHFIRSQATCLSNEQNSPQQHKAFLKCAFELNKIGVNLNQIAKHLNQGHPINLSAQVLLKGIKEQTEALAQVMRRWDFK